MESDEFWDTYEESERERRRQERLEMCGRPYYRRKLGTNELEKFYPRCKEWRICQFCFDYRVEHEKDVLTALGELKRVEIEGNWNTAYRYVHRNGIEYRRYAKEGGKVTLILRPKDAKIVARHFGLKVHPFTPNGRALGRLLRQLPVHKAVTGKLSALAEDDADRVVMKAWAVRADNVDRKVLDEAWREARASFDSFDRAAERIDSLLVRVERGEVAPELLLQPVEALDKGLMEALAGELKKRGVIVQDVFGHKRSVKVCEISLLGIRERDRNISYRGGVGVPRGVPVRVPMGVLAPFT